MDDWLGGHSWWSEKPQHRFFENVTLEWWTIVANAVEPRSRKKGTSKLRIESAFRHPLHAFSCYLQNAYRNRDTKLSIAATQIFISNLSVRHQGEVLQAIMQTGFRSRMVEGWGGMVIGGFFIFCFELFFNPIACLYLWETRPLRKEVLFCSEGSCFVTGPFHDMLTSYYQLFTH